MQSGHKVDPRLGRSLEKKLAASFPLFTRIPGTQDYTGSYHNHMRSQRVGQHGDAKNIWKIEKELLTLNPEEISRSMSENIREPNWSYQKKKYITIWDF